ncbi:MAG: DUF3014 domain-containing protein [Thermoanaerobaculia bacterium]
MSDERHDFELDRDGKEETKPEPWLDENRSRGPWLWIVLAVVVLVAIGLWLYLRPRPAGPTAPPVAAAPAPPETEAEEPTPEEVAVPPLDETDPWLREVIQQLSGHPALAQWLATDDLVQRFVVLVDNVADGVSPAQQVPFVRPKETFVVRTAGDGTYVDAATYERFATLAAVVDSLHVDGTADLYRRLKPRSEEAFDQLGYPDRTFEGTPERAIRRVLAVPHGRTGRPRSRSEGLPLRRSQARRASIRPPRTSWLGPDHLGTVQRKLRALARAAGLDVGTA